MDAIEPFLGWLHRHLFAVVFVASLIDATGLPFPGRAMLVAAGIFAAGRADIALLILTSVLGSLAGDHILYAVGMRGGHRILALYCRLTLGSVRCVETTLAYLRRFGAAALLVCRFSTSVRIFAAVLAGTGQIGYGRFIVLDLIGSVVYSTLWIVLGATFGAAILDWAGGWGSFLLLLGPLLLVAAIAYRVLRRRRFGRASGDLFPPSPRIRAPR